MFAVRTARVFGLALALCFLSGGFAGTSSAQDKKDEKKVKSKLKITVPQDDAELQIEGKATKPTGVDPRVRDARARGRQGVRVQLQPSPGGRTTTPR